jgi:hypothetical protein
LASATDAPFSVQTSAAVTVSGGTADIPISAPSFNGDITLDGAAAGAGTTVALTIANSIAAGFPSFPAALPARAAARTVLSSGAPAPILVIEPVFSAQVTSSHGLLRFALPAADISAADVYYIAYFDPNNAAAGWQLGWAGPAIVSGNNLTFTSGNVTFQPHTAYALVVYAAAVSAPAPTPAPSPTPTAAPLQLSTASVSIDAASGTSPITVTQAGSTATISQTNTCGGASPIAAFSATSAAGPTWTVTITAESGGTCAITFTGAGNQQATAAITATISGISVNSVRRR